MKQKILLMLALWLSLVGSLFAQTATAPTVGDGTEANPYQIATWENLYWLSQTESANSKSFIQTADIDLSTAVPAITTWDGGKGWKFLYDWGGKYNGNGHVIKGLFINRPDENYQGLFPYSFYGTQIINLGLVDVDITGKDCVGGLTGYTSSEINSCYCTGKVTGNNNVGGFIGFLSTSADIRNNYTRCTVTGNSKVGGFVGYYPERHINNCYSAGAVYGISEVGGFAGSSTSTHLGSNVFWDIEASGLTSSIGGKGLTTEEMKDYYNYLPAYFDFKDETAKGTNDYWSINPSVNDGYPFLSWQGFDNMYPPNIVQTESVSDITRFSAKVTGNVIDINNIDAVQYGICWGTNEYPNMNNNVISLGLPSATGAFSITLNDLSPGETYYVRSYVSTSDGTIYGNVISFYAIPFVGSGTDEDPYQISTLEELQRVGKNGAWASSTFVQTANIDASETVNWNNGEGFVPISPFGGLYYGQGHTITGLYINRPDLAEQGLFGYVYRLSPIYPKIKDLGLIDVNITGKNYVGGLVGWNSSGEILRCYTIGNINAIKQAGGLVGRSDGHIANCYSMANVTATSDIGGLVGLNYRNLQYSYSTGLVNGDTNTGGLTGFPGYITASFWDTETSGQTTSTSSNGKPTADMKTQATFTSEGWDFFGESTNGTNDYWIMYSSYNNGYPALTSNFVKNAKPAIALVSENTGNLSFYVLWDGTGENIAYVDWGNGVLLSYTDNTISTSTYVAGNTVKIYGENINYFDASAQGLTALDLSNISTLTTLYCNTNKISSLDVSQNTGLTYISCYDNNLGSLDVSQNTILTYLSCFDNNISSLNVVQNTALATLDCSDNDLTTLDVSQNTALDGLFCAGNQLNFATLPQANSSYSDYSFFPQQNLVATCTNGVVDLSSQLTALGYVGTTTYTWYLSNNTLLSKKYMEEDGVFRFVAEPGTVVYCLMTNPAFPNLTLRTTNITIDAKATLPEPSFTFVSANTEGNLSFGADNGESTYIYIDWGNGELVRGLVDANVMIDNTTTSYIANNMVKVYARGDVYILYVDNQKVTALDVSKLTELDYLNCSNNRLTTLDVSNNPELWALECSNNKLGALNLSQNTIIEELDCSTNGISTLNLDSNTLLKVLNFSGNKISSIDLSANGALTSLNARSNQLNYKTLPLVKTSYSANYTYDLQANLAATCTGGVVDLSAQRTAVDVDGNTQTTEYYWFLANGTYLQKGTDYAEGNGVFYFYKLPSSAVYCEMTNAAFPALTLRTENITIDAIVEPNISFVSENTGSLSFIANNSQAGKVYVDWGDGVLTAFDVPVSGNQLSTSTYTTYNTVKVYGANISQLYVFSAGLTALDVTKCTSLTRLDCFSNKLTSIDLTKNSALTSLSCSENMLTSIDLSHNTGLTYLNCKNNKLTALDVSSNTNLSTIYCFGNELTFRSLPQVKTNYDTYAYAPQANLAATCTGGVVDLSSQLTATDVNEALQTTTYKWFLADGTELATNYMEENGVFRFFVEPGTELYCEMTNAAFPALTLSTENIYIDAKATLPEPNITFVSEKNGSLSFIANNSQAGKVYVDWGDGVLAAFDVPVDGNQLSTSNYTANNTAKVYGANISQLYVFSAGLTALDVTKCVSLTRLDCFSNKLTSLDLTQNSALTSLSCSENMLTSIDLSHNTGLTYLNCKNNKLTALDVSSNTNLSNFFCFGNELTFNSLPQVKTNYDTYAYAPQANLAATCTNGLIDLSSQLTATDANGNTQNTAYAWYLADGTALTEDVDYKRSGGIFFFLKQPSSDVYCSMTNPAFPDLDLRTVDITVDKTLEVNISFVSEKNGEMAFGAKPVEAGKTFVDWGDGELWTTDLVQPMTIFVNPDYVAGSLVKMYGANFQIFNIGSMELSSLDVSKATNLTYLVCNNNKLISLDVSKNTLLTGIECQNNRLSVLDLSHNSSWQSVYCNNNSFNFATLTQLKMFTTYKYSPQANLAASCINGVVDLSSQLTATDIYGAEKTTAYTWYTQSGTGLTAGIDYSEAAGVFTFNSELADSVFCVMSNLAFPELLLQTVNMKITLCTNPTAGGDISGNQSICFGDTPAIFESTELPTGETGTIEYKWQASTESSGAGFVDIESSNAETYAPGALTATTWYKRLAKVTCMSDWAGAVESNVVEVVVNTLPDAPTVPANQNTYIYDGLPKTLAGVVGLGESIFWYDAETGGNSISAPVATNVGTYSAWAETKNDATACTSATRSLLTLTIEKATLTVTAHNQTKVYGQSNPVLTFEYDGFVNNDGVSDLDEEPVAVTTIDELSNADYYTAAITFTGGDDNNYKFDFVPGDFTITKATLTVTAHKQTKVYGQSNPVLTFEYDGFVNNDGIADLDEEPTISTTINELSNAGLYADSITFTGGDDNNYKFDFVPGDFEITKATLAVTAHNQRKVYGENNPMLTFEYSGFVNGDDIADLDEEPAVVTDIDEYSNAGSYSGAITFSGGSDNNYKFSFVPGDFEITKATLTAKADNMTKVYGAQNPVLSISYSGFVNGDDASSLDIEPTISTTIDQLTNAGLYSGAITLSGGTDNNYGFILVDGDFLVTKAILTVKANSQSKEYGNINPYNTFYYKGWVNGVEEIDVEPVMTTTVDRLTPAGMYSSAILISGASDNNYDFNYIPGTYRISQAPLTVTVNPITRQYGDDNPAYTFSFSGWKNNDSVIAVLPDVSSDIDRFSAVGQYPGALHIDGGRDNNYLLTRIDGDIEVVPAMLTVKAIDQFMTTGQPLPELSLSISGFVNGESQSVIDALPTASTTASSSSEPGSYTISVSGGSAQNYYFEYIDASLTISGKQLPVVSWVAPESIVYGTALSNIQLNATSYVPGSFSYSPASGVVLGAGNGQLLSLTFTPHDTNTYQSVSKSVPIDVLPALLTVTALDQHMVAGLTLPEFLFAVSGFVNGDSISAIEVFPTASTIASPDSPAGSYPISIGGARAANYVFDYIEGILTISDKQLPVLTWEAPEAITYGTPLGNLQLNAVASTPGDFSYSPAAGVVLGAGMDQQLSLTFTPHDTAAFFAVKQSVNIDVLQAVLTVTANDLQMVYGEMLPALTCTVSGFVNGDSSVGLGELPVAVLEHSGKIDAGSYPISTQGGSAENYSFVYQNGSLTVGKATITVTALDASMKRGQQMPVFEMGYLGFKNGDGIADIDHLPEVATSATNDSPAGTYLLTPDGARDNNYSFVYVNGSLTIEPGVGVLQLDRVSVSVFPNPFSDGLTIETTDANAGHFSLCNLAGQVLRQGELCDGKNFLHLEDLRNGVYLVNIVAGNKTQTLRVVKQ